MNSLLCSIPAGPKQQGCSWQWSPVPRPAFPVPHTRSCISFKVFHCAHKHMYFLKNILPTPPISVHPYPNFCRIYPSKFLQIQTLLYFAIIKLYRKKIKNEHVNTKTPPLRRDTKPRFLYLRKSWTTKLQFGNSQNSYGSIALRRISGLCDHPKHSPGLKGSTNILSKWQMRNSRNLRSHPAPSPLPPSLPAWLPDPTPGNSRAGRATDQTTESTTEYS